MSKNNKNINKLLTKREKDIKLNMDKRRIKVKINVMKENGRVEITKKSQLKKFPIGSLISFLDVNEMFKMGGFITKFGDDHFTYITPEFDAKYRVKYDNVQKMWVGDVHKVKNDYVSLVKSNQPKTKFKIKLDGVIVFYAKKPYITKKFMTTEKYKRMEKWCNYFGEK